MSFFKYALIIIFHPIDCMEIIKRENKFSKLTLALSWLSAVLSCILYEYTVHFPLATKNAASVNIFLEAGIVIVPLFSWVVCSYAITSLMGGESKFSTQLHVSCYCLLPFTIFQIISIILSQFLSLEEVGFYGTIHYTGLIWCIILLFTSLKVLNDYSFSKAVGVTLISLLAVVVMWAVVLLIASLTIQLFSLIYNLFVEIKFKLL